MTRSDGHVRGKILRFPIESVPKRGFQRAKPLRGDRIEDPGQLDLFARPGAEVIPFPARKSPFDEALALDEAEDDRAVEFYERAIRTDDRAADAYCNLGILRFREDQASEAFDCFTRSLELDPRHFESHYNLGNLYFDAEDLRLAKLHYEIAAELEPSFPNVYFNLGLVQAVGENFHAAIEALTSYRDLASEEELVVAEELLKTVQALAFARN